MEWKGREGEEEGILKRLGRRIGSFHCLQKFEDIVFS